MKIKVDKAYDYYVNNIDRSCNKTIISKEQFTKHFLDWINHLALQNALNPSIEEVPEIGICGKSRYIRLESVISKIS
jgi:hypothetical protein